jgi:hypothetical protein
MRGAAPWLRLMAKVRRKAQKFSRLARPRFSVGASHKISQLQPYVVVKLNIVLHAVRRALFGAEALSAVLVVWQKNPFTHQRLTRGFFP